MMKAFCHDSKLCKKHGHSYRSLVHKTVLDSSGKLDVGEFELQLFDSRYMNKEGSSRRNRGWWLKPSCVPISIILILIVLVVLLPLLEHRADVSASAHLPDKYGYHKLYGNCSSPCELALVESSPELMSYRKDSPIYQSTFDTWLELIGRAQNSIEIASFYWSLKRQEEEADDWKGERFLQSLLNLSLNPELKIRIIQGERTDGDPDIMELANTAEVRTLDFGTMAEPERGSGGGVLGSSFLIIDDRDFYMGSADMHWRSLTQTKDVGIVAYNCTCLTHELSKVFEIYWLMAGGFVANGRKWGSLLDTSINNDAPVKLSINDTQTRAHIASSPPSVTSLGRSDNLKSLIAVLDGAQSFLDVSTAQYLPMSNKDNRSSAAYWPELDSALRRAVVERNVRVRILSGVPKEAESKMGMSFLKSLAAIGGNGQLSVKIMIVPRDPVGISDSWYYYGSQFAVSDQSLYIGNVKWTGNSLLHDGALGLILGQSLNDTDEEGPIREQAVALFQRDWTSDYARPIEGVSK